MPTLRYIQWAGADLLTPVPVAFTGSSVFTLAPADTIAASQRAFGLPNSTTGLIRLMISVYAEAGGGGAATFTLRIFTRYPADGGSAFPGSGGYILDDTGAIRTWTITVTGAGLNVTGRIVVDIPIGAVSLTLDALAAGAGQAGSTLVTGGLRYMDNTGTY